jgi:hypothetical protein
MSGRHFHGLVEASEVSLEVIERKPFLQHLLSTGGEVEYFIGWFAGAESVGRTLDWKLLKRLADLKINLSFVIYNKETEAR